MSQGAGFDRSLVVSVDDDVKQTDRSGLKQHSERNARNPHAENAKVAMALQHEDRQKQQGDYSFVTVSTCRKVSPPEACHNPTPTLLLTSFAIQITAMQISSIQSEYQFFGMLRSLCDTNAVKPLTNNVIHSADTFRARQPGVDHSTHTFLPFVPFSPRSGLSEMEQDMVSRQNLAWRF